MDTIYGEETQTRIRRWCDSMPLEVPDGGMLVDLAAGTGVSSEALARRFEKARVLSVDLSLPMVTVGKHTRDTTNVRWACGDGVRLPLADQEADAMLALHCWPHFPDKGTALAEWRRVLKPGAPMWIVHLQSRVAINNLHHHADDAVKEDRLRPVEELVRQVEGSGFRVLAAEDGRARYFVRAARLP